MRVIAIKDMSAGNQETGEAWKETRIFDSEDTLQDVMRWVGLSKRVVLSIPENDKEDFLGHELL